MTETSALFERAQNGLKYLIFFQTASKVITFVLNILILRQVFLSFLPFPISLHSLFPYFFLIHLTFSLLSLLPRFLVLPLEQPTPSSTFSSTPLSFLLEKLVDEHVSEPQKKMTKKTTTTTRTTRTTKTTFLKFKQIILFGPIPLLVVCWCWWWGGCLSLLPQKMKKKWKDLILPWLCLCCRCCWS